MNKIKITRTLLEKDRSELSPDELTAVKDYNELQELFYKRLEEANNEIVKNCKMLCSSYERYPIPAYGWIRNARNLYYRLEEMNYRYRKYGLRVVLDQAKEKYATFRTYTSIVADETGFIGFINRPFKWLSDKLADVNYGLTYVEDEPGYYTLEWDELTKEQYDTRTDRFGTKFYGEVIVVGRKIDADVSNSRNVTYICEENGKYYKSYVLQHMPKRHAVFTKHRLLRRLMVAANKLSCFISRFYKEPLVRTVMKEVFDQEVERLVDQNERECERVCQDCGTRFDESYSRKCQTLGWYNYVCERCAMARGTSYVKCSDHDHVVYNEGIPYPEKEDQS